MISAFYYVRVLKAMFLRPPGKQVLSPPSAGIALPIVLATVVVLGFGIFPDPLVQLTKSAATPMLSSSGLVNAEGESPDDVKQSGTPGTLDAPPCRVLPSW